MNDKVSIIIPCFNGENTIDRAIQSVYDQKYRNTELIVVDDGSTDRSKDHIFVWKEKFEVENQSLIYVHQANKGLGGAVNTGLKEVSGDYLMLLDADDEFLPGAISKRVSYLEDHPECHVVRSNGYICRGEHKFLFVYEEDEKHCQDVFSALLRGETNNWAGSYMIRTKALFAFYPDREIFTSRSGQNLQMLLPVTYQRACGFIDEPLMNYIQQENSLSQISNSPELEKKRKLENAAGYREIREHMLRQIVQNSAEYEKYHQMILGGYWRAVMMLAIEYDDRTLLKQAKTGIAQSGEARIQDKIMYYKHVFPPMAVLIRIINKLHHVI